MPCLERMSSPTTSTLSPAGERFANVWNRKPRGDEAVGAVSEAVKELSPEDRKDVAAGAPLPRPLSAGEVAERSEAGEGRPASLPQSPFGDLAIRTWSSEFKKLVISRSQSGTGTSLQVGPHRPPRNILLVLGAHFRRILSARRI
jgi:hypothetical protein